MGYSVYQHKLMISSDCGWVSARIEMGDKFISSLNDAGELLLLIRDFALADAGEYKVVVENEVGAVSQIIRMEMSGNDIQHNALSLGFIL